MTTQTFEQVPIEEAHEYWDRRPCNIRHSTKPAGSLEYFDEVEQRKYLVEPHIPRFAEFPRWQNKRVLEVGCDIVTDTMNFARHCALVKAVAYLSEPVAQPPLALRRFLWNPSDCLLTQSGGAAQ